MFGGKFNRIPFNLKPISITFFVQFGFADSLVSNVKFGADIAVVIDIYDEMSAKAKAILSIPILQSYAETCDSTVFLDVETFIMLQGNETFSAKANLILNMQMSGNFADDFAAAAHIGKDLNLILYTSEALNMCTQLSKNIVYSMALSEILSCEVSVFVLENQEVFFNVTVPSGGEIRINSEVFTAFLNNQNILHLHSGNWITVDKSMIALTIDSGNAGNISGTIIFNERYL